MSILPINSKSYKTLRKLVGRHAFSEVLMAMSTMANEAAMEQTSGSREAAFVGISDQIYNLVAKMKRQEKFLR